MIQLGIIKSKKASPGSKNLLAILSKWYGPFTPDNIKNMWFLKFVNPNLPFCSMSVRKDSVTSTAKYKVYSIFLEDNFNSINKILTCFICIKLIEIRCLVLIIWYEKSNFLLLTYLPPKMCAIGLRRIQNILGISFVCWHQQYLLTYSSSFSNQIWSFASFWWVSYVPHLGSGIIADPQSQCFELSFLMGIRTPFLFEVPLSSTEGGVV